jgi:hypothetical protein
MKTPAKCDGYGLEKSGLLARNYILSTGAVSAEVQTTNQKTGQKCVSLAGYRGYVLLIVRGVMQWLNRRKLQPQKAM